MRHLRSFSLFAAFLLSTQTKGYAQNPSRPVAKEPSGKQGSRFSIRISPSLAETLLDHKEEPVCLKNSNGAKITGTMIVAITIDKTGNVIHAQAISGLKALRPAAVETVRKYHYKPYLLNTTPVKVDTTVSIPMSCSIGTGQA